MNVAKNSDSLSLFIVLDASMRFLFCLEYHANNNTGPTI